MSTKEEKKDCETFLEEYFLTKQYQNVMTYTIKQNKAIKVATIESILTANKTYCSNQNIESIFEVENVEDFFFQDKTHEKLVLEKTKNLLSKEPEAYAKSVANSYKNHILNTTLNWKN